MTISDNQKLPIVQVIINSLADYLTKQIGGFEESQAAIYLPGAASQIVADLYSNGYEIKDLEPINKISDL